MPTHSELAALTPREQTLFAAAVRKMIADPRARKPFRASLRVKGVQGYPGIFEMTWEMPNGRATFSYGPQVVPGEAHIIWRRIGGHDILSNP